MSTIENKLQNRAIKKRTYTSETRLLRAAETKCRILTAAKELFRDSGFESAKIEKIAQMAAVSEPTIYSLFQSKIGILRALMDESLPIEKQERLMRRVNATQSAEECLKIAAKISRQMYDAERMQMDIFRSAYVLAPEFKELEKEREERRYKRQEETTKANWLKQSFIEGLSLAQVRDIIWTFTGRDMYRMLVIERGWTSTAYEKWLAQLLIQHLIRK